MFEITLSIHALLRGPLSWGYLRAPGGCLAALELSKMRCTISVTEAHVTSAISHQLNANEICKANEGKDLQDGQWHELADVFSRNETKKSCAGLGCITKLRGAFANSCIFGSGEFSRCTTPRLIMVSNVRSCGKVAPMGTCRMTTESRCATI